MTSFRSSARARIGNFISNRRLTPDASAPQSDLALQLVHRETRKEQVVELHCQEGVGSALRSSPARSACSVASPPRRSLPHRPRRSCRARGRLDVARRHKPVARGRALSMRAPNDAQSRTPRYRSGTERARPRTPADRSVAQKSWHRLGGHNHLPKLVLGLTFSDGIEFSQRTAASPDRPSRHQNSAMARDDAATS